MYERLLSSTILNDKQAKVYIACLRRKGGKTPEIAQLSGLKRTTVYGIIDELEKLGLISKVYKGKSVHINPLPPEKLTEIADEQRAVLDKVVPELDGLFSGAKTIPRMQFFEGVRGIKKIYSDILECRSKEVFQLTNATNHTEILGKPFITEYIKKRAANKIKLYDLHPKSGDIYTDERGLENRKLLRQVRYLPSQIFKASVIAVYDNKVGIISSKKENYGLLIESHELATSLKEMFHFLWGLGSEEPEK